MGQLTDGTPMPWEEVKKHADQVRKLGIQQLIEIWRKYKDRDGDVLLWGDEIEYQVVSYDEENENARLSLRDEILSVLSNEGELRKSVNGLEAYVDAKQTVPKFHPEFTKFMLESIPGEPFGGDLKSLLQVEKNMRLRRLIAKKHMAPHEAPITMACFPRLGTTGVFTDPYYPPNGSKWQSQYVPEEVINSHIRFITLNANTHARRGGKVAINIPIFYDDDTQNPFKDPTVDSGNHERNGPEEDGHIYLDSGSFGMGCCSLQITLQAKNISEARILYDQLVPLGPILLALTAATPIVKGFLVDTDARWNMIRGASDDRTEEELGIKPLKNDRFVIPKSRFDSVSTYIADDRRLLSEYNDIKLVVDESSKKILLDSGMDETLAKHFASLFIRDPLMVLKETLEHPPEGSVDHFENIQCTNWQHMRFKPPPGKDNIGWRVEFRSMEVQMTDFENTAFAIFLVLLTKVILSYGLNFYIPISKVDENMATAHARDAVGNREFWFRRDIFSLPSPSRPSSSDGSTASDSSYGNSPSPTPIEQEFALFTINEIINGSENPEKDEGFIGLIPLIEDYLDTTGIDLEARSEIDAYLNLVRKRASGELYTAAKWIREFVRGHEEYKKDSVVTQKINYDLVKAVEKLGICGRKENGNMNWAWADIPLVDRLFGKYVYRRR